MKDQRNKSVSLLELLIAIVLLCVLVLGLSSIDVFSRHHVVSSDRRSKLQNEIYLILEHMAKNAGLAIGNEVINGPNTVVNQIPSGFGETAIVKVYIDAGNGGGGAADGIRQAPIVNPTANDDHWIAYRYFDVDNGNVALRNQVQYCDRCSDDTCATCMTGGGTWTTLGTRIITFSPSVLTENYIQINPILACWVPGGACGSTDVPQISMRTCIKLPSISTN